MLNQQEINEAIAELENLKNHNPTARAQLADLYAIRDHAFEKEEPSYSRYSLASAPTAQLSNLENYGDSDFLLVIEGKAPGDVFRIINNLMDTLSVVNPRVYDSVMRKIRSI